MNCRTSRPVRGATAPARALVITTLTLAWTFLAGTAPAQDRPLRMFYEQPATRWVEALPIGNGRLGAMVFGGRATERIQLNEDSIWAGDERVRERSEGPAAVAKIRELLFAERHEEAEALAQRTLLSPRLTRSYQTLGDLGIAFDMEFVEAGYRRELDLTTGLTTCERHMSSGGVVRQTAFASAPAGAMVVRLEADPKTRITATVRFSRAAAATTRVAGPDLLVLSGHAREKGLEEPGVRFEGRLRVRTRGGSFRFDQVENEPVIRLDGVEGADLIVTAATSYRGQAEFGRAEERSISAMRRSIDALQDEHIAEHRSWMDRFDLEFGSREAQTPRIEMPTDERLERVRRGEFDEELLRLYVQYARYLLLASSRPGSLPANLQGLWCEHVEGAPWNADYHVNINVQMNYWPAGPLALSTCEAPLFDWADGLMRRGRETAWNLYRCRGFVAHHTSDAWQFTVPIGRTSWGLWPCGAAWLATMYVDHWRFTGDDRFARERAFPFARGAAEFFCDWLAVDPATGKLVSGPSMSPENGFHGPGGKRLHVDMGPAMDGQIVAQLFDDLLELASALDEHDDEVVQRVSTLRPRLDPPKIGKDGRLLEWRRELPEAEPGHRHISHAFALFPGRAISPLETPELAQALRKSIDTRLANGGGHTGWSRAWIACLFARLRDGNACLAHLEALLAKSTLPNLFDDHPPFQIDGNFGGAAAVAAMFVQDHHGILDVLPALPDRLQRGRVRGLCARGGVMLDLDWDHGRLQHGELRSEREQWVRVRLPISATMFDGDVAVADIDASVVARVLLTSGRSFRIEPR
ncbi:MAG: glycoside hydrolase family 95 protein [Planctomycetes bacterium]|nr:glycoside hydrolase family 95 protein [Planctomycetota bacterium]MCB9917976.1 glycoside hydrolase family 95 protein [Planctomycetota bacterium]